MKKSIIYLFFLAYLGLECIQVYGQLNSSLQKTGDELVGKWIMAGNYNIVSKKNDAIVTYIFKKDRTFDCIHAYSAQAVVNETGIWKVESDTIKITFYSGMNIKTTSTKRDKSKNRTLSEGNDHKIDRVLAFKYIIKNNVLLFLVKGSPMELKRK